MSCATPCFRMINLGAALVLAASCASKPPRTIAPRSASVAPASRAANKPSPSYDEVDRTTFNRLAAELFLPLFWVADVDGDRALDADELAVLWGFASASSRERWVDRTGRFTPALITAYGALVRAAKTGPSIVGLSSAEAERRRLVRRELAQGRPTLVLTDMRKGSAADRVVVREILGAARLIEQIYARQKGVVGLAERIPADDSASKMMFHRNQGPWCVAPKTEAETACSALVVRGVRPAKRFGLYPGALQQDDRFCEALAKRSDGEQLLHQFHVVTGAGTKLEAKPYSEAFKAPMREIGQHLLRAAAALGAKEQPFVRYLRAAARAFTDNNWLPADEAWAKMNAQNSRWYLRIGPDEVYFEPCNRKAGFHVSFARINQDSLRWQRKLEPHKLQMERELARLAGKPYRAKHVAFHLPDFIDIVINAGDSRNPHGATIGQSLPNWGPVANEGRGRTVAMTNLYTDTDSRAQLATQASSLLCKASSDKLSTAPEAQIMGIVLHEAAHNLGPAHEYKVRGKKAPQIFGGPLASTLEELKAQTSALHFVSWLAGRGVVDKATAERSLTRDVVWAFGHISRGMYSASGKPKPYSQLAAIQLGFLRRMGALQWKAQQTAANGSDSGCLELSLERFPKVVEALLERVAGIKARGDKAAALELRAAYVDAKGEVKKLLETIRERWLRAPKASFVYAIRL